MTFSPWIVHAMVLFCSIMLMEEWIESHVLGRRVERVRHHAATDPETGLLTSAGLNQRVSAEIKRVERYGGSARFTVIEVDEPDARSFGRELARTTARPRWAMRLGPGRFCVLDVALDTDALPPALTATHDQPRLHAGWAVAPQDAVTPEHLLDLAVRRLTALPPLSETRSDR